MYEKGRGVTQDFTQALSWYQKAADQGSALAQNNLGVMYAEGRGVIQDYSQALKWYRKAAEQNIAQAQYNLGNMYAFGRGVVQQGAAAVAWYLYAAGWQHAGATYNLGVQFDEGGLMKTNIPLSYALYNLAASYGSSNNLYAKYRDEKLRDLEQSGQVALGQEYARRLASTKNFRDTFNDIINGR